MVNSMFACKPLDMCVSCGQVCLHSRVLETELTDGAYQAPC